MLVVGRPTQPKTMGVLPLLALVPAALKFVTGGADQGAQANLDVAAQTAERRMVYVGGAIFLGAALLGVVMLNRK